MDAKGHLGLLTVLAYIHSSADAEGIPYRNTPIVSCNTCSTLLYQLRGENRQHDL